VVLRRKGKKDIKLTSNIYDSQVRNK